MNPYEKIQGQLRAMIESGMTQKEISDVSGISQSHISKLLSAKKGIEALKKMELSTLFKLFEGIDIVFGDDRQIGNVQHNVNSPVIQGDGNTIGAAPGEETAAQFLKRIMASDDIDAETKVKIYRMMK